MAAPNFSPNERLNQIIPLLNQQMEDITSLKGIAEKIMEEHHLPTDTDMIKTYNHTVGNITTNQQNRFLTIDSLINENIYSIKKGKTLNDSVLNFGKEVRKIEAGVRTAKLFLSDILNATDQGNLSQNQIQDRNKYVVHRANSIQQEILNLKSLINDEIKS